MRFVAGISLGFLTGNKMSNIITAWNILALCAAAGGLIMLFAFVVLWMCLAFYAKTPEERTFYRKSLGMYSDVENPPPDLQRQIDELKRELEEMKEKQKGDKS